MASVATPHPSLGYSTDPLAHLYDKRATPKRVHPTLGWNKLSQNHRRVIELAIKGLTTRDISKQLQSEGINLSNTYISTLLHTPLAAQRIEQALNQKESVAVEQRKALDEMLGDAQEVLHQASKGTILQPKVDENGEIVPDCFVHVPVGVRDRIAAAREILNRHPSTAPVTRSQNDVTHHGLLSPEAVFSARRDLDRLISVSTGVLAPPPSSRDDFVADLLDADDEDETDGTPPWPDEGDTDAPEL